MNVTIHPSAVVSPEAKLSPGVRIGAMAYIGPRVVLGPRVVIHPQAHIKGQTEIGEESEVFAFAVVGAGPQGVRRTNETGRLVIGARNQIREHAGVHVGTAEGVTVVGNDNLIMTFTHIAHDCQIGNHVVMSTGAALAGHVVVEDHATLGGQSGCHQYVRVGESAYLGGKSAAFEDVAPFSVVVGTPARMAHVNRVGLERRGVSPEQIDLIERTLEKLVSGARRELGEDVLSELKGSPEVSRIAEFFRSSRRGVAGFVGSVRVRS